MRKDLQPLCEEHRRPMRLDVEYLEAPGEGPRWIEVYRCAEANCWRRFESRYGYYQTNREFKFFGDARHRRRCGQHPDQTAFVAGFESGQPLWQCEQPECVPSVEAADVPSQR